MIATAAWRSIRAASKAAIAKDADLYVFGTDYIPAAGPVLLVARHYHHLYDGAAIISAVPREIRILVGLDWIERSLALTAMRTACRAAEWPVVSRNTSAKDRSVWLPELRAALRQSLDVLVAGKMLLVFPEGYPTIDPHGSPKTRDDEFLPFHSGFAKIAVDSWRQGIETQIVPVGLHYRKSRTWEITLRFGPPLQPNRSIGVSEITHHIERQVVELSR
ncbi:MAG: 1-acyl-sn-glycerol-3-phosphate acyltransferase [Thermomicrobiales bacterium]|nr:1-acyl-sn-glycerol-3-phosphate acyltransferase [Thermomicrobiales bacterium]